MHNYKKVIELSNDLISAVDEKDAASMQSLVDNLETAYKNEFGDCIDGFEAMHAFVLMNLASVRYFSFNNMFSLTHLRYEDVAKRITGFMQCVNYNGNQKAKIQELFEKLETINSATPERHKNTVVNRCDTRCCLCRVLPANKTGSHMVPNFLTHPTFSWDGKGKRFHEALNHDFLNDASKNCTFYGRDVPEWRFAKGEGKEIVSDEDIQNNINQIEYDNEFCTKCEDRFGILESEYSRYYSGQQKNINPRIAYLFWLSVLWRMSMGSMSIFMDMNDELALRKLLDENILNTLDAIINDDSDLGTWKYALFKVNGLKEGDKGIFGHRKECSPYVVIYNDLVMAFFHSEPTNEELTTCPIVISRDNLNDWTHKEIEISVDRQWFWKVRDWMVDSSYEYYDPAREKALRIMRERERSEDRVIADKVKDEAIKIERIKDGPKKKIYKLRKMQRIYGAWMKIKEAKEKGEYYNPLKDEELFLNQHDFDLYFQDLADLSRSQEFHDKVSELPFYEQAREAIPDDNSWSVNTENMSEDDDYLKAMKDVLGKMSPKDLDQIVNGKQEPYINHYKGIGRNDPCPCGSGKKYKNCCGR